MELEDEAGTDVLDPYAGRGRGRWSRRWSGGVLAQRSSRLTPEEPSEHLGEAEPEAADSELDADAYAACGDASSRGLGSLATRASRLGPAVLRLVGSTAADARLPDAWPWLSASVLAAQFIQLLAMICSPIILQSFGSSWPTAASNSEAGLAFTAVFWVALSLLLLRTLVSPLLSLWYPLRLRGTRLALGWLSCALYPALLLLFLSALHYDPAWARPRPLYAVGSAAGIAALLCLAACEELDRADFSLGGVRPFGSNRPSISSGARLARMLIVLLHVLLWARPLPAAVLQLLLSLSNAALVVFCLQHQRQWTNDASAAADAALAWASGCSAAASAGGPNAAVVLVVGLALSAAAGALLSRLHFVWASRKALLCDPAAELSVASARAAEGCLRTPPAVLLSARCQLLGEGGSAASACATLREGARRFPSNPPIRLALAAFYRLERADSTTAAAHTARARFLALGPFEAYALFAEALAEQDTVRHPDAMLLESYVRLDALSKSAARARERALLCTRAFWGAVAAANEGGDGPRAFELPDSVSKPRPLRRALSGLLRNAEESRSRADRLERLIAVDYSHPPPRGAGFGGFGNDKGNDRSAEPLSPARLRGAEHVAGPGSNPHVDIVRDHILAGVHSRGFKSGAEAFLITTRKCVIQSVSDGLCRLLGYRRSELIGQNARMLIPTPFRDQHDVYAERCMRTGQARVLGLTRRVHVVGHSGDLVPVAMLLTRVTVGSRMLLAAHFDEITTDPMESGAGATIALSTSLQILAASAATARMLGLTSHDLVGKSIRAIIPEAHREESIPAIREYLGLAKGGISLSARRRSSNQNMGTKFLAVHKNGFNVVLQATWREADTDDIAEYGPESLLELDRASKAAAGHGRRAPPASASTGAYAFVSYRGLFDEVTEEEGIVAITADGTVTSVNRDVCTMLGYSAADLVGNPVTKIMPDPYRSYHQKYLDEYMRTGIKKIMGQTREVHALRSDGSSFPVMLRVMQADVGGEVTFVGRLARAGLSENSEGVVTASSEGVILSCNDAALAMFGYRSDEIVCRNVKILMPAPYSFQHDGYIKRYMLTGAKRIIGTGGRNLTAKHRNGHTFPVSLELSHSKIDGMVLFTAKLVRLLEMDALVSIDQKGKVLSCNANMIKMFGFRSSEQLIGRNISICMPDRFARKHDRYMAKYVANGGKGGRVVNQRRFVPARHMDGSTFNIGLEVSEILIDGYRTFDGRLTRVDGAVLLHDPVGPTSDEGEDGGGKGKGKGKEITTSPSQRHFNLRKRHSVKKGRGRSGQVGTGSSGAGTPRAKSRDRDRSTDAGGGGGKTSARTQRTSQWVRSHSVDPDRGRTSARSQRSRSRSRGRGKRGGSSSSSSDGGEEGAHEPAPRPDEHVAAGPGDIASKILSSTLQSQENASSRSMRRFLSGTDLAAAAEQEESEAGAGHWASGGGLLPNSVNARAPAQPDAGVGRAGPQLQPSPSMRRSALKGSGSRAKLPQPAAGPSSQEPAAAAPDASLDPHMSLLVTSVAASISPPPPSETWTGPNPRPAAGLSTLRELQAPPQNSLAAPSVFSGGGVSRASFATATEIELRQALQEALAIGAAVGGLSMAWRDREQPSIAALGGGGSAASSVAAPPAAGAGFGGGMAGGFGAMMAICPDSMSASSLKALENGASMLSVDDAFRGVRQGAPGPNASATSVPLNASPSIPWGPNLNAPQAPFAGLARLFGVENVAAAAAAAGIRPEDVATSLYSFARHHGRGRQATLLDSVAERIHEVDPTPAPGSHSLGAGVVPAAGAPAQQAPGHALTETTRRPSPPVADLDESVLHGHGRGAVGTLSPSEPLPAKPLPAGYPTIAAPAPRPKPRARGAGVFVAPRMVAALRAACALLAVLSAVWLAVECRLLSDFADAVSRARLSGQRGALVQRVALGARARELAASLPVSPALAAASEALGRAARALRDAHSALFQSSGGSASAPLYTTLWIEATDFVRGSPVAWRGSLWEAGRRSEHAASLAAEAPAAAVAACAAGSPEAVCDALGWLHATAPDPLLAAFARAADDDGGDGPRGALTAVPAGFAAACALSAALFSLALWLAARRARAERRELLGALLRVDFRQALAIARSLEPAPPESRDGDGGRGGGRGPASRHPAARGAPPTLGSFATLDQPPSSYRLDAAAAASTAAATPTGRDSAAPSRVAAGGPPPHAESRLRMLALRQARRRSSAGTVASGAGGTPVGSSTPHTSRPPAPASQPKIDSRASPSPSQPASEAFTAPRPNPNAVRSNPAISLISHMSGPRLVQPASFVAPSSPPLSDPEPAAAEPSVKGPTLVRIDPPPASRRRRRPPLRLLRAAAGLLLLALLLAPAALHLALAGPLRQAAAPLRSAGQRLASAQALLLSAARLAAAVDPAMSAASALPRPSADVAAASRLGALAEAVAAAHEALVYGGGPEGLAPASSYPAQAELLFRARCFAYPGGDPAPCEGGDASGLDRAVASLVAAARRLASSVAAAAPPADAAAAAAAVLALSAPGPGAVIEGLDASLCLYEDAALSLARAAAAAHGALFAAFVAALFLAYLFLALAPCAELRDDARRARRALRELPPAALPASVRPLLGRHKSAAVSPAPAPPLNLAAAAPAPASDDGDDGDSD